MNECLTCEKEYFPMGMLVDYLGHCSFKCLNAQVEKIKREHEEGRAMIEASIRNTARIYEGAIQ